MAEKPIPGVTQQPQTDFEIASSEVYIDKIAERKMMRKFDASVNSHNICR